MDWFESKRRSNVMSRQIDTELQAIYRDKKEKVHGEFHSSTIRCICTRMTSYVYAKYICSSCPGIKNLKDCKLNATAKVSTSMIKIMIDQTFMAVFRTEKGVL